MEFRQFVDDDLGCTSYLIGDSASGECVVVDPAYAIGPYLEEAERRRCRIVRVLETHTHADHVSGHGRLALEHGVPVSIHRSAGATFPHDALEDGTAIELGQVRVETVHTPGHRPEHCCFTVTDRSRGDEPWLVLTGDSLFVGDAARPDLASEARAGAAGLFASLRRLLELPDGVEVYPGHVAGSLCGKRMSSKASTTIGFERRFNPTLAFSEVSEFVAESAGVSTPKPPGMERIVELNRGPFVAAPPELRAVAAPGDAVVLDVRPARDFCAGHVPGALSVPVSGSSFATKAGFVLAAADGIVLHASDEAEARLAARGLNSVGFLDLAGWLAEPETTETLTPVRVDELDRLIAEGEAQVIDVREQDERDEGYIPGTRHIPYRLVRAAAGGAIDRDRPVVTLCESGARAAVAASVLAAEGYDARPVLGGGIGAWQANGGQTVEFRRCGT
jgi:hydroxyacylglutathione hydrolase